METDRIAALSPAAVRTYDAGSKHSCEKQKWKTPAYLNILFVIRVDHLNTLSRSRRGRLVHARLLGLGRQASLKDNLLVVSAIRKVKIHMLVNPLGSKALAEQKEG